ncbi:yqey-like protein [Sarocladium implicatum]|nr:yqey-like protein [Sarocladium implicatum]
MVAVPRSTVRCLRLARPAINTPRAIPSHASACLRFYAVEASPKTPKSLAVIKDDLKKAMRAKDAPRLAVLRSILSANLNASKTTSPVQTDVQLVALIRKIRKQYEDAAAEAEGAGRADLVEKEKKQMEIVDGYIEACGVQTVAGAELEAMVEKAVAAAKEAQTGSREIMGKVMGAVSAQLEGKDVERKTLAEMVKKALQ